MNQDSSSSDDDDYTISTIDLEEFDISHQLILNLIHRNNNPSIQQNIQPIHGGSIPGHVVINRDREAADRILFDDYFAEIPRFNDRISIQ